MSDRSAARVAEPTRANSRLDALVAAMAGAIEAGEPFPIDAIARDDPSLADRLRQLAPTVAMMADPGPALREEDAGFAAEQILGDYRLIREVGRGGMGVVFEAEQVSLRRRVALKILPTASALDPRQRARFQVEAQAAASLRHPHIVPIFGVGSAGGAHFLAMQFIDGPSLADVIRVLRGRRGGGGRSPGSAHRSAAALARQAAEAMAHAHDQGVVHRDLKPANLMIDAEGHLWVVDFGLARLRSEDGPTATGDLVGTLRYLSPEQAMGGGFADPRSDVYAIGVTLYELLTLRPAFDGLERAAVLRRIIEEEPARPRKLDPSIPRDLETILLKAMAKEPAVRYDSAAGLADDLLRFLEGLPIQARRAGPLDRAARWARRHRAAAVWAGAALTAIVVGLGTSNALLLREAAQREGALARLRSEEGRTRANLRLAARVLDDYGRAADGRGLDRDPERAERETALLENSLGFCLELARRNPGDPEASLAAARAHHRLADRLAADAHRREAELAYGAAGAILDSLAAADPEDLRTLREQAALLGDRGRNALMAGRSAAAESCHRRSLAGWRRIVGSASSLADRAAVGQACLNLALALPASRPPQAEEKERLLRESRAIRVDLADPTPRGRIALAEVDQSLTETLRAVGRHAEAAEIDQRAVATAEALQAEAGDDPARRLGAARLLSQLTWQLCRPIDPADLATAERSYRRSLAARARMVEDFPHYPSFRDGLAAAYLQLVSFLLHVGQGKDAEEACGRAVAIHEGLVRDYPSSAVYRRRFTSSSVSLGSMIARSDHPGGALPVLNRALAIDPASRSARSELARLLATCPESAVRDPARAVELAGRLVVERPGSGADWGVLGEAKARAGDPAGARAAIEAALRLGDGDRTNQVRMALAFALIGDRDEARAWLARAATAAEPESDRAGRLDALRAEVRSLLGPGPDGAN